MLKAADYWKKAVQRSPWRLDLSFWLARLYQDLGDFEAQYQTLAETLQYADQHKGKLQWGPNRPLPEKPSKFVPAALQDYENYYFAQQSQTAAEKAFHLARLSVTFYPNNSSTYNSMAAYYWFKNDWEHALKYLILAAQKNPRNGLVLNNLGNTLAKMGKKREAKIYYQKVVELNLDEEYVSNAKRRLEELSGD
jgi:tetratricopeptide (TPR) repeat protein